jgi:hypothetical protein
MSKMGKQSAKEATMEGTTITVAAASPKLQTGGGVRRDEQQRPVSAMSAMRGCPLEPQFVGGDVARQARPPGARRRLRAGQRRVRAAKGTCAASGSGHA